MHRLVILLVIVSFSAAALADEPAKPTTSEKESGAPLMVSYTEMKWTDLPERKGMQFALLSGDLKKGALHADAESPGRDCQPAAQT